LDADAMNAAYNAVIERFVRWAQAQPDICAARVVGSRATGDADPLWSDLDIEFFTTRPLYYRRHWDWIEHIAPVWGIGPDDDGRQHQRWTARFVHEWTLFTTFDGGLAVDFMITHAWQLVAATWQNRLRPGQRPGPKTKTTVLFDKDERLRRLGDSLSPPTRTSQPGRKPSRDEFAWVVKEFWGAADRAVRKLGRGDLFEAKRITDIGLKNQLVTMLAWHTHAREGWNTALPVHGRYLDTWADPRAVVALRGCYAHYYVADVKRALCATMDLFRWVATETAACLSYDYPAQMDRAMSGWIIKMLPLIRDEKET
jgi:hypothetical protein